VTRGDDHPRWPVRPFLLVDLLKALAKSVNCHAHNGVDAGIEIRPSPKGFGRNRVLLDLMRPTREALFADVLQHPGQIS